jgi:hypothetical protein
MEFFLKRVVSINKDTGHEIAVSASSKLKHLKRKKFSMIYLYLKTHNVTGLKYLGKTIKDPLQYKGSGTVWMRHIKKHGYDVKTEILFQSTDKDTFKEVALKYSKELNIVESKEFANLTYEEGQGGSTLKNRIAITDGVDIKFIKKTDKIPDGWSKGGVTMKTKTKEKIRKSRIGKTQSKETKEKISKKNKGRNTGPSEKKKIAMNKPEVVKKLADAMRGKLANNRKSFVLNGVHYDSIRQCHEVAGISKHQIRKHLKRVVSINKDIDIHKVL